MRAHTEVWRHLIEKSEIEAIAPGITMDDTVSIVLLRLEPETRVLKAVVTF